MKNKSTEKLLNRLNRIKNKSELKNYINQSKTNNDKYKLSEYILNIAEFRGYSKSDIIRNADIYRTYGYQILNGHKTPSRDKLLQICAGNKFTLDETNRALTLGQLGVLYPKDPRDSIIIYVLNRGLGLINGNIILDEHGFKSIGEI